MGERERESEEDSGVAVPFLKILAGRQSMDGFLGGAVFDTSTPQPCGVSIQHRLTGDNYVK